MLKNTFGDFYLVPEGGTNDLVIKRWEEILTNKDEDFDYICSAVGTWGTIAGLIKSSKPHQTVLGFSALKEAFQSSEIRNTLQKIIIKYWIIIV